MEIKFKTFRSFISAFEVDLNDFYAIHISLTGIVMQAFKENAGDKFQEIKSNPNLRLVSSEDEMEIKFEYNSVIFNLSIS
jgi:hypothetical protein